MKADSSKFEFVDSKGEVVPALRHRNPDGSIGGWVAATAVIESNVIVEAGALVGPHAVVRQGQIIRRGISVFGPD